jgi:4-hydroxyacetophenone monooxygenase
MTYGPNTNPGGGSTIFILEAQVHYILEILRLMLERGIGAVECRQEPYERYNRQADEAHNKMIWTHPGMDTYYRNTRGRVVTNMPWRVVDYWHLTRNVDIADFDMTPTADHRDVPTSASTSRDTEDAPVAR